MLWWTAIKYIFLKRNRVCNQIVWKGYMEQSWGRMEKSHPKKWNTLEVHQQPQMITVRVFRLNLTIENISIENISPVGTSIFDKEKASYADHKHARRWKSRPLTNRVRIQESTLTVLSRRVHRCSKEDFFNCLGMLSHCGRWKTFKSDTSKWNGKFSVKDIIVLTKLMHSNERKEIFVWQLN